MRILTIVQSLGPGGTERAAQNYALGYKRAGHASAMMTFKGSGQRANTLRASEIPVFETSESGDDLGQALRHAVSWQPNFVHVHRKHPDERSTMVLRHLRDHAGNPPVLECNVFGKPDYTSSRHLIDVHQQLTTWCLWKWQRWTSDVNPRPLAAVIPYTVDPDAFGAASTTGSTFRRAHGIPGDAFVIGRVGQPDDPKWSPAIVSVFEALAREDEQVHLVLVGASPSTVASVSRLSLYLRNRVTIVPFLISDDELRGCYRAMDVFLHAADLGESFGMVLVEAMIAETPVVTLSRVAKDNSQTVVVGHERGGLVANNVDSLIAATQRLRQDKFLRTELGRRGAEYVRLNFAIEHVTGMLLRLAELMLRERGRESLRRAIARDATIVSSVSEETIRDLVGRSIGRVPLAQRAFRLLIHQPWVYRRVYRPPK